MKIKRAVRDHLPTIAHFQKEMAFETEGLNLDEATLKKGVNAVFDDPAKGMYFVAEDGGKVIASTLLTPEWSDWRNGKVYWIQSVYVLPAYRGKGVFKSVFSELKRMMKEDESVKGLRLYVDKTNNNAIEVYKKLGMNGDHYQLFELMKGE
jgi:GNAT superfamily N-acetyltransferase